MSNKWQIWIDTGGTFTDAIAQDPNGNILRTKVLSSGRLRGRLLNPVSPRQFQLEQNWRIPRSDIFAGYELSLLPEGKEIASVVAIDASGKMLETDRPLPVDEPVDFELTAFEEAPVLAARLITATPLDGVLPPIDMRLGSTRGTNALLEGKGAHTALLISRGFSDLIAIGTQQRPDLFQLHIPEPVLLYKQVWEIDERLDARGKVLQSLDIEEAARLARQLRSQGFESVAVALLHAYCNPVHERLLGEILREAGFRFVSLSHELTPSIRLLPRTQTALVNAYLSPVIHEYLSRIEGVMLKGGRGSSLRVMTSTGGLVSSGSFQPKDSLLSGPAGGVVGAAQIARQLGFPRILTLDMGGTSTDTARYDGHYDYQFTTAINRIEMSSPSLAIETVAAGGGSICHFNGSRLCVGPESAGASPGPACYGAGGPLTITDVNLLLGKLDPSAMGIPVSIDRAREALLELRQTLSRASGQEYSDRELLRGLEQIADELMAEAIRRISVARGFDPKDYTLLAFGGAGGLHACRIAELLDIDSIILPADGGLLSAYGIGMAQVERIAERQVLLPLDDCADRLKHWAEELGRQARQQLDAEGFSAGETDIQRQLVFLRFKGQDHSLELPLEDPSLLAEQFAGRYRQLFGHFPADRPIEVESIRIIAASRAPTLEAAATKAAPYRPAPARSLASYTDTDPVPVFFWEQLQEGALLEGPAILLHSFSSAYLARGWQLRLVQGRNAVLERRHERQAGSLEQHQEAIELELFTNRFRAIAEEMGAQLRRTAFSVNIKERLDFSCALLDADAELLVNAPHIPVHLGSLGICTRLVRERIPIGPGDVVITNHPKYGGSHLPDVTLISGVFSDEGRCLGYVVNRAHHAEIGGSRPGSMPPDASRLVEEGVVILPQYLVKAGEVQWEAMRRLLSEAPYPSRSLEENLADINAALASLRSGTRALRALAQNYGAERVAYYMAALKASATQALNEALAPLEGREFTAAEQLDDGHEIRLHMIVQGGRLILDFSGSSAPHPLNLNANLSIVYSAVLYVLRLLCNRPIPLNEGLLVKVDIRLPLSFLHPDFSDDPADCPAVVGGNTEVSQRLVDTLLRALALAACSQGTMNNFLFGNDHFGYYETIGGGAGAGPGFAGRSGVHQHMTNTRITDPEELEFRYPVRLHRFSLRHGSGGRGRWPGGDGIIREIEFLEPMSVTILSQHRRVAPYGMAGGEPGAKGQQWLISASGTIKALGGIERIQVSPGDRIKLETPGGGAWGASDESAAAG